MATAVFGVAETCPNDESVAVTEPLGAIQASVASVSCRGIATVSVRSWRRWAPRRNAMLLFLSISMNERSWGAVVAVRKLG